MLTEALLVQFEQPVPMAMLFPCHLAEQFCGVRITFGEVLGECHVDAAVFLLGGDRNGEHFTLGQLGKILHADAPVSGYPRCRRPRFPFQIMSEQFWPFPERPATNGSLRLPAPVAPNARRRRRDGSR